MRTLSAIEEMLPNGIITKSWTRSRGDWLLGIAILIAAFQIVTGWLTLQELMSMVRDRIITPEQMKMIGFGIGGVDIALISLFLATGMGGKMMQKKMETSALSEDTPNNNQQ